MPKALLLKDAAARLDIQEATLRVYISRGKIQSTKDNKGRCVISEEEINRYIEEKNLLKEKTKDCFSIKDIEEMGISKNFVTSGEIESINVNGKLYVHFKEMKRYLRNIRKTSPQPSKACKKTLKVFNRGGIHFRPSAKIVKICNKYKNDGISVKISYDNRDWLFPSMGVLELLLLRAEYLNSVSVFIEGGNAELCLEDLSKAFKERFDINI